MTIKVLINGAQGRMGQEAVKAINATNDLTLVGETGHEDDLASAIKINQAQVVVDLTVASVVYENTKVIIDNGAHPVIGTSGLLPEQVLALQSLCEEKQLGGIIAPNFSIGAVLMMRFAKEAAKYLPDVEIIELHHDKKQDAPSGTAVKTAQMIAEGRKEIPPTREEKELIPGARGAVQDNIHIHAVRLPGFVAHQAVIFGGQSESLTLRHDSIHRECFMPGILTACRKVVDLNQLVYGLEHVL